jgi:hypothetical protein
VVVVVVLEVEVEVEVEVELDVELDVELEVGAEVLLGCVPWPVVPVAPSADACEQAASVPATSRRQATFARLPPMRRRWSNEVPMPNRFARGLRKRSAVARPAEG